MSEGPERLNDVLGKFASKVSQEKSWDQIQKEANRRKYLGNLVADLGRGTPTLDGYKIYHQNQNEVIKRVRDLAGRLDEVFEEQSGIIWYGSVGTGKDHMAAALLYVAAGKFVQGARWVSGLDLYGAFRDGIGETMESETILRYMGPDVLCISDPLPPLGELTPWNVQILFRILDGRTRRRKTTWATMNVRDLDESSKRLTAPVFDRLRDRAYMIPCFWPSFRKERM